MNHHLLKYIFVLSFFQSIFASSHFVLISAPGSGKGTFSQCMIERYGYIQICPGDIFRHEIRQKSELGIKIQPIVDRGDYVEEDITCELMRQHLTKVLAQGKSFILDGFPRSEKSFVFLDDFLKQMEISHLVRFVTFEASDHICAARMTSRLICTGCFRVYNTQGNMPKNGSACDVCGTEVTTRSADTLEIAKKRLDYFHNHIEPLLEQVLQRYPVHRINTEKQLIDLEESYDQLRK